MTTAYNKTCLYSATAGQSTVNLSEPLSAFERYVVKVSPGVYWESICTADRSNQRFNRYGDWNHQGYMNWPANWVISNGTKTMTCNRFQMLGQNSATNTVYAFGWNNTAGNIKHLYEVWGINRKEPIETEGSGKPQGDGWKEYNETLLWSGTDYANQSVVNLSGRALEYERLKVGVGSFGESTNLYEVDAPTTYTSWLPLYSYWGTNTGSFYYSNHRYKWDNETQTISAVSGKTWQLGTAAVSPYTTTGNYTATDTFVRRPLFAIWGINHKSPHKLTLLNSTSGSITADRLTGYEFDTSNLSYTANRGWDFTGYDATGATVTNNILTFQNQNGSVQAGFSAIPSYTVTILPAEHGSVIASMPSGYRGEIVTLTNTPDEGWYYGGYDTTGCTINKYGEFVLTADAIIQPKFSDVEFRTLTLLHSEGGTLTANELTGVPGETINLSTAYDTYWRFSGYQLTGDGEIVGNDYTFGTEDATICACYKKNAFTANGNFEKGSNANYSNGGAGGQDKYGVMTAHTGDIPASWYSTSNRWNPSNASAYNIAYTGKMTWTGSNYTATNHCYFTARMYVGGTTYNQQVWGDTHGKSFTFSYSKTGSVSNQGYIRTYGYGQTVKNNRTYSVNITYIATGTNGSWTATGYAP